MVIVIRVVKTSCVWARFIHESSMFIVMLIYTAGCFFDIMSAYDELLGQLPDTIGEDNSSPALKQAPTAKLPVQSCYNVPIKMIIIAILAIVLAVSAAVFLYHRSERYRCEYHKHQSARTATPSTNGIIKKAADKRVVVNDVSDDDDEDEETDESDRSESDADILSDSDSIQDDHDDVAQEAEPPTNSKRSQRVDDEYFTPL